MQNITNAQNIGNPSRVLRPKIEGIPELLRQMQRWIPWKVGRPKTDGSGRYDKIPVNAKTGAACNAHKSENWLTFEEVCRAYESGRFSGIAIDLPNEREPVATAEDGAALYLIGGDIDECVSKGDNGKPAMSPDAKAALLRLGMPCHELCDYRQLRALVQRRSSAQRHSLRQPPAGEDHAILVARHALYATARKLNPARWSGKTRNWSPIGAVTLNPERDCIKAHSAGNNIQPLAA